jgi:hypothetical protein
MKLEGGRRGGEVGDRGVHGLHPWLQRGESKEKSIELVVGGLGLLSQRLRHLPLGCRRPLGCQGDAEMYRSTVVGCDLPPLLRNYDGENFGRWNWLALIPGVMPKLGFLYDKHEFDTIRLQVS